MELEKYESIIEAILFVSGSEVSLEDIAKAIEKDKNQTENIIKSLSKKYESSNRGIKIIQVNNSFQLCTNPKYFDYIKKVHEVTPKKILTQPMLEALAIITYKQPVTKAIVQEIRGVNSDQVINSLVKLGLVEEKGRLNAVGKPILLGTSEDFLKHFDFNKISDFYKLIEEENLIEETPEQTNLFENIKKRGKE